MSELKLEVGKTYKSREGDLVKIVSQDITDMYPFNGDNIECYNADGSYTHTGERCPEDLIEEVPAEENVPEAFERENNVRKDYITKSDMSMFVLVRDEDETGVSGTGAVAEGVEFTNGICAMTWLTEATSTAVYPNIKELERIHGHGGKTRVVWLNTEQEK